uniref:Putative degreening-enhanced protein n=1 Tax=Auxenochlorella protothecoides TaxID=3075 RepID=Q9XFX9_AUXPR|nr:putative degreening-enhanced protein [Auxenochlorella protothecoides]
MQVSSTALSHRQAPFGAAAGKAKVQFRLPKRVSFGQTISIVTSRSGWEPIPDLHMDWSEGDEWKVSAEVAPGDELEYKYVVLGPSGIVEWQTGSNRRLAVDVPGGAAVTVVDEWHGPTQQVSVELPEALQATSPLMTRRQSPSVHPLASSASTVCPPACSAALLAHRLRRQSQRARTCPRSSSSLCWRRRDCPPKAGRSTCWSGCAALPDQCKP